MSSPTTRDFKAALYAVQMADHFHQQLVNFFRTQLPAEFLASLPETFQGYTQDQYQYWLEPCAEPLRPELKPLFARIAYSLPDDWYANKMAPRFLNGVQIVVEEVLPGDELVVGAVYCNEFYDPTTGAFRGSQLARFMGLEKTKFLSKSQDAWVKGYRQHVQFDNDFMPGLSVSNDNVMLPKFLNGTPEGVEHGGYNVKMFRFIRYSSFDALILPTKAFPRRDLSSYMERQRKWREQQDRDNARRRESRARKKRTQLSGGLPGSALVFVPRQPVAA